MYPVLPHLLPRGGGREKEVWASGMEQVIPLQHRRPHHQCYCRLQLSGGQQQGKQCVALDEPKEKVWWPVKASHFHSQVSCFKFCFHVSRATPVFQVSSFTLKFPVLYSKYKYTSISIMQYRKGHRVLGIIGVYVFQVPWTDLRYLFGEIMYGGHITDDWDRRLCRTYLEEYMKPELVSPTTHSTSHNKSPPSLLPSL